jgi:WD40 repeat protein
VAFSPSGRELIASGKDRSAAVWDSETGENIKTLEGPGFALDLDVSPDGALIAMTGHRTKPLCGIGPPARKCSPPSPAATPGIWTG